MYLNSVIYLNLSCKLDLASMTTSCDDDDDDDGGGWKWRLVASVEDLRDRPCRRLHPLASFATDDLVLVFVARLGKFFALDGSCGHMGE